MRMPDHVERRGGKWVVVETATGDVKSHHDSKRKAELAQQIRGAARAGKFKEGRFG